MEDRILKGRETAGNGQTIEVLTGVPAAERTHRPRVGAPYRRGGA